MFLGWYDADKKYPIARKVTDAVGRYQDKFGTAPQTCLASVEDAELIATDPTVRKLGITIVGATYVPRNTFYVGDEDIVIDETAATHVPAAVPAAA
jgi:hypothetical protein